MPLSASFPPLSSPVTDVRWSCCDIEGREKKKECFFGGFWTCQTVLLGVVGMKEEVCVCRGGYI